ncbi:MAG: hypothetical protein PHO62_07525 [Sulfurimonas sp.]|nr:hypothetical protein [Sulfurimonas sp.]MDD5373255.1 hypothetical protein [Sulfurimonas sp.]
MKLKFIENLLRRFYIDMNENITHSKADIQKAKDWFLAEHSIVL